MAKDKLRRFAEFKTFTNAFDFPYENKGKWCRSVFDNTHPITLELGCGKGEYTVALAGHYPDKNFIGIDIKSNRMWKGAGLAMQAKLPNAAFARILIHKIEEFFDEDEVSEIWITFPDPFPKDRHAKHRLTHTRFLRLYKKILKAGGIIHFKTDDTDLFRFTVDMLPKIGIKAEVEDWDVHNNSAASEHLKEIRTHYEKLFMLQGRTIKYLRFSLEGFTEEKALAFEAFLEEEKKSKVSPQTER